MLHTWFHQPLYPDYAYVRVTGIMGVGMSMMLVLVAQKIEEVWWWSWAFVMVAFGLAALGAINAVWGLPYGASSGLWWLFAGSNTVITVALIIGLQAGTNEKPFV